MSTSTLTRTLAVGAACALAGAAAGIAESSASSASHQPKQNARHGGETFAGPRLPGLRLAGPGRPGHLTRAFAVPLAKGAAAPLLLAGGFPGPAVHSEAVVPNEKGGFETVTSDSGLFSSLSGEQLTIEEGTRTASYKSVTLTIPGDATVYRNGEKASLSDIKTGDMVSVVQSAAGTFVNAWDEQHEPKAKAVTSGSAQSAEGKQEAGEEHQEGEGGEAPPPPTMLHSAPAPKAAR